MAASGKLPKAWGAGWLGGFQCWGIRGLLGRAVTVSGGGFLTSGLERSATNHKVWGWRLISQLWGPEVFSQKL